MSYVYLYLFLNINQHSLNGSLLFDTYCMSKKSCPFLGLLNIIYIYVENYKIGLFAKKERKKERKIISPT